MVCQSWLQSWECYAIVSPTYQYQYIGHANRCKSDFVNFSFLEQFEEGSNIFSDKNCREDIPIAQLFHKLRTAPQSVPKYRSKTQGTWKGLYVYYRKLHVIFVNLLLRLLAWKDCFRYLLSFISIFVPSVTFLSRYLWLSWNSKQNFMLLVVAHYENG